jgi:hypothetical protein
MYNSNTTMPFSFVKLDGVNWIRVLSVHTSAFKFSTFENPVLLSSVRVIAIFVIPSGTLQMSKLILCTFVLPTISNGIRVATPEALFG